MSASTLRVWHIVNVPGPPFHAPVADTNDALKVLQALAAFDRYLGDGEDKRWTTVEGRRQEIRRLSKKDELLRKTFERYVEYLLERCPGGVPLVASNAQGLEELSEGEWCEYYDEEGRDIRDIEEDQKGVRT